MNYSETAWAGRFPMVRGGVAKFTLQPHAPFMIGVRADANVVPKGKPLFQCVSEQAEVLELTQRRVSAQSGLLLRVARSSAE